VTLRFEYAKGLRTKYIADLPSGQTDQETLYIYGTTKGTPPQSKIASGDLLRATRYPDSTNTGTASTAIDSDASDVVSHAYNAQGEEVLKKDQAGNVIERTLDTRGRETARRVTTLASGFDGAVRRIETAFDALGRTETVTQLDAATSGSIVDQVKYSHDAWGNLALFEQDRNSAVGASGSVDDYEVGYAFVKATNGRQTLRRDTLTLPSGNVLTFKYRTRNGLHDDEASRVTDLMDGATVLALYAYNGAGTVVGTDYPEPDVMSRQYTSTLGDYADLDRFDRVVTSKWTKDLTTDVDFYRVAYTWDRNSNVTSADDQVHTGFDVKYGMDGIDRLVDADEGTLASGSISSRTRRQQWTLNQTGNWDNDKVDLNGDGDWADTDEVNDTRTHNAVNELSARNTNSSGGDEFTLTYDALGNLTDDGDDYQYEWDAFGRLRKVKNTAGSALIAEYRYNGLGYRIAVHEDTDTDADVDSNDKWYYDAFDERWRQVARFRESDTSPKEEFVPHAAGNSGFGSASYIDLVVCRDKDANTAWTSAGDGTLEERVYYCQNWRADVSAIVSPVGDLLEWVKYSAYGVPFGLPVGDSDSDGDCDYTDVAQVQLWINSAAYDLRGDVNADGDVDVADKALVQANAITLGGRGISSPITNSDRSWQGSLILLNEQFPIAVRMRLASTQLGRWASRDLIEMTSIGSLYGLLDGGPLVRLDPDGLTSVPWHQTPFGQSQFSPGIGNAPSVHLPGPEWRFPCLQDSLPPSTAGCDWIYGAAILSETYCFPMGTDWCGIQWLCVTGTFSPACVCKNTPNSPYANCIRQCLACTYQSTNEINQLDHASCLVSCAPSVPSIGDISIVAAIASCSTSITSWASCGILPSGPPPGGKGPSTGAPPPQRVPTGATLVPKGDGGCALYGCPPAPWVIPYIVSTNHHWYD